ncbi:putative claudin-24 [Alosa alosa]|uniref:putative claudin-24 n=1 Tax=Alosa sapidissima TaxID=34773 RepID=UPI001C08D416|nr:putative claudin-24 [Alosa sapidissima]XP_048108365.1 putative claudin-24 [Alosa alosa]
MGNPCICALELLGMLVGSAAWFCSLATMLLPQWLTLSTELLPTESFEQGLWETCVVQEMGGLECRPYDTILGLQPEIQMARILMCLSLSTSLLGLLVAVPGLSQIKSCQGEEGHCAKRALKIIAGTLCVVSGVVGLVPVSVAAHTTVVKFFDERVPEVIPRWEFGDAIFIGWVAGFLHVIAGVLFITSCPGSNRGQARFTQHHRRQEVRTIHSSPRKHSEYV